MKHFTSKLLIVSSIIMILAAMPAFGDDHNHQRGPDVDITEIDIVSGCIISIYDCLDGILLCVDSNCAVEEECSETIRIFGIGPEYYWKDPCIVKIPEDGVIKDFECLSFDPPIDVSVPEEKDFVTIGTVTNSYEELVAVWAQTNSLQKEGFGVLLRDENFNPIWQAGHR
jgi:hypothetical protein